MTMDMTGAQGAGERARIAALLAAYPDIDPERVAEIKHWFLKSASALDVALLASEPDIANQYRRFPADHIDRIAPSDIVVGVALLVALVLTLLAMV